mmetsp:Transcript_25723/g.54098  ORF Transcript_25723/g.54098 Transcript_25723/m.54098 type:complete len:296 (+) Transcript_25723:83-970(+)
MQQMRHKDRQSPPHDRSLLQRPLPLHIENEHIRRHIPPVHHIDQQITSIFLLFFFILLLAISVLPPNLGTKHTFPGKFVRLKRIILVILRKFHVDLGDPAKGTGVSLFLIIHRHFPPRHGGIDVSMSSRASLSRQRRKFRKARRQHFRIGRPHRQGSVGNVEDVSDQSGGSHGLEGVVVFPKGSTGIVGGGGRQVHPVDLDRVEDDASGGFVFVGVGEVEIEVVVHRYGQDAFVVEEVDVVYGGLVGFVEEGAGEEDDVGVGGGFVEVDGAGESGEAEQGFECREGVDGGVVDVE